MEDGGFLRVYSGAEMGDYRITGLLLDAWGIRRDGR